MVLAYDTFTKADSERVGLGLVVMLVAFSNYTLGMVDFLTSWTNITGLDVVMTSHSRVKKWFLWASDFVRLVPPSGSVARQWVERAKHSDSLSLIPCTRMKHHDPNARVPSRGGTGD